MTMVNNTAMKTINASTFKSQCLQLMDRVASTGEKLVITKHGKPVSLLSPFPERSSTLFARHRESLTIHGDILAPIDESWDAEQ